MVWSNAVVSAVALLGGGLDRGGYDDEAGQASGSASLPGRDACVHPEPSVPDRSVE